MGDLITSQYHVNGNTSSETVHTFDVEQVLGQLTVHEKIDLLAGESILTQWRKCCSMTWA